MINLKKYNLNVLKPKLIKTATIATLVFTMGANINVVSANDINREAQSIENQVSIDFDELDFIIEDIEEELDQEHGNVNLSNLYNLLSSNKLFQSSNITNEQLNKNIQLLTNKYGARNFSYIIKEIENQMVVELISEVNYISIIIDGDLIKTTTSNKPGDIFSSDDNVYYETEVNGIKINSSYRLKQDGSKDSYKVGSYNYTNQGNYTANYKNDFSEIELENGINYKVSKENKIVNNSVVSEKFVFSSRKDQVEIKKEQYEFLMELFNRVVEYPSIEAFAQANANIFNNYLAANDQIYAKNILDLVKQNKFFKETNVPMEQMIEKIQEFTLSMYDDIQFDVNMIGNNKYRFTTGIDYINVDLSKEMFKATTNLAPIGNFAKSEKIYIAKANNYMQSDLSAIENSDERGNSYIEGVQNYYTFDKNSTHLTKTTFNEISITNAKSEYEFTISKIEYIISGKIVGTEYTISSYKDVVTISEEDYISLLAAYALAPSYKDLSTFAENNLSNFEAAMNNQPLGK